MSYYPILVNLQGEKVIVVGGGGVARRKIETLLEYRADVHVISRDLTPALEKYREEGRIKFLDREFRSEALKGAFLVIAATDDPILNQKVGEAAKEKGILVNVVDQPSDCNFIVPSVIKRGDLVIAVSTSGKSPALAKRVRRRLSGQFGKEYEDFLVLMGRLRTEILATDLAQEDRGRLFKELVDSRILQAIAGKDWDGIASELTKILHSQFSVQDVTDLLKTG